MQSTTVARRLAVSGVATALAAGALVGVSAGSAQAATSTYTCTTPLAPFELPMTATATELPTSALPGAAMPGVPVEMLASVPASVAGTLAGLGGLTGLTSSDFALDLAGTAIPVEDIAMGELSAGDLGALDVPLSGESAGFAAPATPGEYPVTMPREFTMLATTPSALFPEIDITCVTDVPATLATLLVGLPPGPTTKAVSTTVAKAKRSPIARGKVARIVVKVRADDTTPTGKVVLKRGKRTLAKGTLSDRGRVVLKTRNLKVGKNRLVAKYRGDDATKRSKDRVVVRVKRRR